MMRVLMSRSEPDVVETAWGVTFSPGGDQLAIQVGRDPSTTRPHRVDLLELGPSRSVTTLCTSQEPIGALAYSSNGRLIAAACARTGVVLWRTTTLEESGRGLFHKQAVTSLVFSPDSSRLVTGTGDMSGRYYGYRGLVKLWDFERRKVIAHRQEANSILSLAYSPDGQTIAVGTQRIQILDEKTFKVRSEFPLRSQIRHLTYLMGGRRLAYSTDRKLGVWDLEWETTISHFEPLSGTIHAFAASPDGRTLASGSTDGIVRLWGYRTGREPNPLGLEDDHFRELASFDWDIGAVRSLAFSPDGSIIAAGGDGPNFVILWDLE